MSRFRTTLALLPLLALATTAFATAPELPRDALAIPLVRQAQDYSCGAAALLSVLYYWQAYDSSESSLYPLLETTPKDGTEPPKIAEVARALGLDANLRDNLTLADLQAALARGDTAILALQAWRGDGKPTPPPWKDVWDEGHYAVLIGLDREFAYFMDPSGAAAYTYVPIPELLDRWHDYEDRHGAIQRYLSAAILVHGKKQPRGFPGPLIRME